MYSIFSCEKTLLDITHDKKDISKFPHTMLQSFMITERVHLSQSEKYWWLNLEFAEVKTVQKMKFSFNDFFSKCGQIRRRLRIWSHLLKKSLMENFIFCAVSNWIFQEQIWIIFSLAYPTLKFLFIKKNFLFEIREKV